MHAMGQILRFTIFIAVAVAILGGIHFYFWVRLVRDPAIPVPWRYIATGGVVFLFVTLPLALVLGRTLPFDLSRKVVFAPYVWMGMMLLLFIVLISADAGRLAVFVAKKLFVEGPAGTDMARRILIARSVALAAIAGVGVLTAISVWTASGVVHVKPLEIRLSKLPKAMDGFTIAEIADLHLGITLGRGFVEDVVRKVNDLHPDVIVITGDLVDGSPDRIRGEVRDLKDLKAPNGVFFVTGNHEYYSGVTEWIREIEQLGIRVLRNERVPIGPAGAGFDLAGVDDYEAMGHEPGHGSDVDKALAGLDPGREVVLLAHQPRSVREAARHDVGLVLSGHTHGGQIWPWSYFVYLQQPYVRGLHCHGARTQIYITDGTGYWGPPMRLGTRGEITYITLRSK